MGRPASGSWQRPLLMMTCLLAASPADPQLRGTRATGLPSRCRPSSHQLCMLRQSAAAHTLTLHDLLKLASG